MKPTIFLLTLLIASSFTMTIKKSAANNKSIDSLKKDRSWSKIVLNLAELHMMSDFPLSDLIEAIESLVSDLNEKVEF